MHSPSWMSDDHALVPERWSRDGEGVPSVVFFFRFFDDGSTKGRIWWQLRGLERTPEFCDWMHRNEVEAIKVERLSCFFLVASVCKKSIFSLEMA